MVCNSDDILRRTFNFPAVKPCECVSLKTLITSLITLCSKITSFKSHDFVSNKHKLKNIIRLIDVLLVFLSDFQDNGYSGLPRSEKSPLLEVHVILQKLVHVVVHCTGPHARLWVLVNSGPVSDQLRALMGSLVEALEGLMIEGEEKDYVFFLIKQGKKMKFEVERDDLWAKNLIFSVMNQFEKRVIPDPDKLRLLMGHLGINNWSDCNKQVRFLEEETGSDPRVSGLMGLMVYCRSVVFSVIDDDRRSNVKGDDNVDSFDMGFVHLEDFKCPISLEFMVDPVTISSGHTYDRRSIIKWFNSGNPVCPKTGQELECLDLVPNLVVKQLIKLYCLQCGIPFSDVKYDPKNRGISTKSGYLGSLEVEGAMNMVADFLAIKLAVGTKEEKNKAAYEIRLISKRSNFNRACLVESGVIPHLLNLLLVKDSITQENSTAALLNLSKHPRSKAKIVDHGGLTLIIRMLKKGLKLEVKQHTAGSLFYLSSVEDYRRLISNNPDTIPSLVELIRVGGDKGRKNALVTIYSLLSDSSNYTKLLESRLITLLVTLLGAMENEDLILNSLTVLSLMAEKPEGARLMWQEGALDVIIGIICASSHDTSTLLKELCASLLLALTKNGGKEVVEVLAKKPSLMGALYALIIEGSARARKKASSLINIIHEFTEFKLGY